MKFKDIDALKAKALEKREALEAKGMSPEDALAEVNSWLKENDFTSEAGDKLELSLSAVKEPPPAGAVDMKSIQDVANATAKAIAAELLPGLVRADGKAINPGRIEVKEPWLAALEDPTWGFKHVTDFARSIVQYKNHGGERLDTRLGNIMKSATAIKNGLVKATPTTYASELVGADGGFLVPPEYRKEIWIAVHDDYSILPMIDLTPTSSNVVNLNVDENTPWDLTTGIFVGWRQQATTMTQSKPVFQNRQVNLNEIFALVPATDELLDDAPMLNNYLGQKAPEKMGYAIDEAIFRGAGQGQPLGFMGANSTQTITANSTVNGFSLTDLANMYPHLLQGSNMQAPEGVWIMTPREYALLPTLGTGSNAGFPLALTNQNIEGRIILSALGMPIYSSQHCAGANQKGSIVLANMKGYMGFNKVDGFDFQSSIHLFFDSGATALRWRFRFGGEPKLKNTVASANDTGNAMSHFILLGGRPS